MIEISREDLQKVFDTAVNSLDFGSGFLDHDEVAALRRVAILLEVHPDTATPHSFLGHEFGDGIPSISLAEIRKNALKRLREEADE